ncbi:MAG: alanine--tRNA ligase [Vampirovibrionales bacterium]|nr:alanine--tRNA ligase [Vampirovibrionales bacterium]
MPTPPALGGAEIRRKFLDFFCDKYGHRRAASASLTPSNPTVLLTPAGMLPFVPIFLGIEPPPAPPRAASSQKCARVSGKASDLENVGRTPHHHTFFEMLGNFSFGDYFKAQAIPWAWEFITQELGLSPHHLWVSVLKTERQFDEEAFTIWRDQVGVPESRILFLGEKDNFWGPPGPTGPCGPCSEIHYDRHPDGPSPKDDLALLDTDRFTEIWNLVFMELFQDAAGTRTPLEKKNIDTGMGLERITMVCQGVANTFETDLLRPLVERAAQETGATLGADPETDVALRIIADHARFTAFALADGITPSNEGRGYVARMILRRAMRFARQRLGAQEPVIWRVISAVASLYGETYPELKKPGLAQQVQEEEKRFLATLDRGAAFLDEIIARLPRPKAGEQLLIPGESVFKLYDTYGFPKELTADIAAEKGFGIDEAGFDAAMDAQRDAARKARKGEAIVADQLFATLLDAIGPTRFVGYETLSAPAIVKALIVDGQSVDSVGGVNQPFSLILDQTPFYAESGGQVGDHGTLSREEGPHGLTVVVRDTVKVGELIVHHCLFDNGDVLRVGEPVSAQVEPDARQQTAIHHTATHLLNAALRQVLGEGVSQAGSRVAPDGARFDFTFSRGLTSDELNRTESLMNFWIRENIPRAIDVMDVAAAKASGAVAAFDEKYGDTVRVLSYGPRSRELCGGTHVSALGEIALVKILSEGAIAAGVRRIELAAGETAYKAFKLTESALLKTAELLKSPPQEAPQRVERLQESVKTLEKRLKTFEAAQAEQFAETLAREVEAAPPRLFRFVGDLDADGLRLLAERLLTHHGSLFALLASAWDGRAQFVCVASEDYVQKGFKAGDWVKKAAAMAEGGGGGKPGFAQAGGKRADLAESAVAAIRTAFLKAWEEGGA